MTLPIRPALASLAAATLLLVTAIRAEVRVYNDATISAQGVDYGLDGLYNAKLAADGGVWLAASNRVSLGFPYGVTEYLYWAGRLSADGSVAQFDYQGRSPFPIYTVGFAPIFAVSPDRRHAAYTSSALTPAEIRGLSLGGAVDATLIATEGGGVSSDDGAYWDSRGFGGGLAIDNAGRAVVGGWNGPTADDPLDTPDLTAIWRVGADGATRLAVQGDPAPGVPGAIWGVLGRAPSLSGPLDTFTVPISTNARGDVAFAAALGFEGLSYVYDSGVWIDRGDGPALVALTGQEAPGAEGYRFSPSGFSTPAIDSSGRVAFLADTYTRSNGWDGLWRESAPGALEAVAHTSLIESTSILGQNTIARPSQLDDFVMNSRGDVAFRGEVDISTPFGWPSYDDFRDENAIWLAPAGAPAVRIATGWHTPPDGRPGAWDQEFSDILLNNAGQVAYVARVLSRSADGAVTEELVVRATDASGQIVELLREGDLIAFGADGVSDRQAITDLSVLDFDDTGRALVRVNAGGLVALVVLDAAAVPAVSVPEPSTTALGVLLALVLGASQSGRGFAAARRLRPAPSIKQGAAG